MKTSRKTLLGLLTLVHGLSSVHAALPDPGVKIDHGRTALVITDPQNDFLSPDGVTWGVVGKSVVANNTVANIETLFKTAKANNIPVFVSPHYYFKHDHKWQFEGALEKLMHNIGMFDRKAVLSTDGFEGSGADWLARYKPYINDGETVVTSPHKVYGPETNDLILQLRKRGIDKVILGGMSANLCTESHMRELIEQGFEVAVVSDATAAAQLEEGDGYRAASTNFRFIANTVWTTKRAVKAMEKHPTQAFSPSEIDVGLSDSAGSMPNGAALNERKRHRAALAPAKLRLAHRNLAMSSAKNPVATLHKHQRVTAGPNKLRLGHRNHSVLVAKESAVAMPKGRRTAARKHTWLAMS